MHKSIPLYHVMRSSVLSRVKFTAEMPLWAIDVVCMQVGRDILMMDIDDWHLIEQCKGHIETLGVWKAHKAQEHIDSYNNTVPSLIDPFINPTDKQTIEDLVFYSAVVALDLGYSGDFVTLCDKIKAKVGNPTIESFGLMKKSVMPQAVKRFVIRHVL